VQAIRKAIRKLKNGLATVPDGFQPELLKYAEEPTTIALHTLFYQVWKAGKVPNVITASIFAPTDGASFSSRIRFTMATWRLCIVAINGYEFVAQYINQVID